MICKVTRLARPCVSVHRREREEKKKKRQTEKTKAHTDKQTYGHISEMQVGTTALNYTKCAGPFFFFFLRKSALFFPLPSRLWHLLTSQMLQV